jgi:DNA-directed RNA polymerase subunit beta'
MTKMIEGAKGEGKYFASPNEAILAYDYGYLDLRAKVHVLPGHAKKYEIFGGKPFETTVGRLLFNTVLPKEVDYINAEFKKKDLSALVDRMINEYGMDATAIALDRIKSFGYRYVTISGTTFSMDEAVVPEEKARLIKEARDKEQTIREQYEEGLISDDERYRKVIEIWEGTTSLVGKAVEEARVDSESINDIVKSGARGSAGQLNQTSGVKGLIINNAGRIIDYPIVSSYKDGLTPLEYFITNHGSRKGLSDTALNTAKAGYLTRKLVIVAQDIVVNEEDCGTKKGLVLRSESAEGMKKPLSKQAYGRVVAETVKDSNGEVLFKRGTLIGRTEAKQLDDTGITEMIVRSPLSCESTGGICRQCYGLDLGRNAMVKFGEAMGVVAAQAIGEPGTQLTLRTIHAGGVAGEDITMGLPRVEELFECRPVKVPATISTVTGEVSKISTEDGLKIIEVTGDAIKNEDGSKTVVYEVDHRRMITVKVGAKVTPGMPLTDGSLDVHELFAVAGPEKTQEYIIKEISKVYELHSAPIARKHLEIIVRQMCSRRRVTTPGDTRFTTGDIIEARELVLENREIEAAGKMPAKGEILLKGISDVSHTAQSWMSAAAFQNTTRTLVQSALRGKSDELRGLMENVIVGNLVPAGTGIDPEFISDLHPEEVKEETSEDII